MNYKNIGPKDYRPMGTEESANKEPENIDLADNRTKNLDSMNTEPWEPRALRKMEN